MKVHLQENANKKLTRGSQDTLPTFRAASSSRISKQQYSKRQHFKPCPGPARRVESFKILLEDLLLRYSRYIDAKVGMNYLLYPSPF